LIQRKFAAWFFAYGRIPTYGGAAAARPRDTGAMSASDVKRISGISSKESAMTSNTLPRAAILAAIVVAGASSAAVAQMADPHHADATTSQATPSPDSDDMASQGQNGQPAQPGMMGRNMQSGMPMMGMRGHMMKVMFAVADVDGDGALSFEEVTTIHKRIFDKVDANKDGKVTLEEVQAFMRP
jgi:hypothetical protein